MRLPYAMLIALTLAACFDNEKASSKAVKVVDARVDDPAGTTKTQAVADADFKALQDQVKELTTKLNALQVDSSAQADKVNALYADPLKAPLWLYDGNGVKRFLVISLSGNTATVAIGNGIRTTYIVGVKDSATGFPPRYSPNFSSTDCTGAAFFWPLPTGQLIMLNSVTSAAEYAFVVTPSTPVITDSRRSTAQATGSCYSGWSAGEQAPQPYMPVTLLPGSGAAYGFPNPMTVGP